jgi:hypothetical protein
MTGKKEHKVVETQKRSGIFPRVHYKGRKGYLRVDRGVSNFVELPEMGKSEEVDPNEITYTGEHVTIEWEGEAPLQ